MNNESLLGSRLNPTLEDSRARLSLSSSCLRPIHSLVTDLGTRQCLFRVANSIVSRAEKKPDGDVCYSVSELVASDDHNESYIHLHLLSGAHACSSGLANLALGVHGRPQQEAGPES